MVDIKFMSTLTLTSLVIAICFTIITIAGIFFLIYRKGNIKNTLGQIVSLFVFPMITIMMWTLAGLSTTKTFSNNEALAIILSLIIGIVVDLLIFLIAKSIETTDNNKVGDLNGKSQEDLCEDILKVEADLSTLKTLINDVIETPKPEKTEEKQPEPETKIQTVHIIEKKVEEPKKEVVKTEIEKQIEAKKDEVKEEIKEEPKKEVESKVEDTKEIKEPEEKNIVKTKEVTVTINTEPVTEAPSKTEDAEVETKQASEVVEEEKVETKPEKKVEDKTEEKVEDKTEEKLNESRESDFIKSLNEILSQLEEEE